MIKRQKVKKVGTRVVNLVLRVVALDAECARPFAEIDGQARPDWSHVRAIDLEQIPIDLRPELACGAALQRLGRLAILQVKAQAEALPCLYVRSVFDDHRSLID